MDIVTQGHLGFRQNLQEKSNVEYVVSWNPQTVTSALHRSSLLAGTDLHKMIPRGLDAVQ
jgi:hypothetical protein